MIVKAAVARSGHPALVIETLELDDPRRDEVLVRLIASGVGQADLDATRGLSPIGFPLVPGGEGAGIVERVGDGVSAVAPGDAVILGPAFCGRCPACRNDAPQDCEQGAPLNASGRRGDGSTPFTDDGHPVHGFFAGQSSFGTHVLCHSSCAVKIAKDAPLEALACLGGEARIAASAVLSESPHHQGDGIVITGAGALGLFATMAAHTVGATPIIVADPDEARRALASEIGATLTVHTDDDLAAVVKSLTGAGARLAIETTGRNHAIEACLASLAPGGTCRLLRKADRGREPNIDLASSETRQIVSTTRGLGSPHTVIATLAAWHADGHLPLDRIVGFYPFEHINDALRDLTAGAIAKPVLRFSVGSFDDLDRAGIEGAMADVPNEPVADVEANEQAPSTAPKILT